MAGFIDAAVHDIDNRLKELKEEESRLLAARAALAGTATTRRGPGRPPRAAAAPTTTRRKPGRPRGSVPLGPDDDPEFLRLLAERIRGEQ